MIGLPSGAQVWLAVGRTDMMGWTPLANRGQGDPTFLVQWRAIMMDVKVIGIDVAKRYFQVHGVSASGAITIRRKISRDGFLKLLADLSPCLVGLEAGSGAHHWARQIARLGHDVRLMPPQFVRPYVKTNKNDAADAEACCEAVQRPGMRFVPVKSLEQQAAMALHRVRDHLVRQRTGTINALRGHLAEYGIVASALRGGLNQLFSIVHAEDDNEQLPTSVKELLRTLVTEIRAADAHIAELDRKLKDNARADEACRRLVEVPGIGPVIATAVVATVPDDQRFSSGRHFAAWLGLTPKQHSSGGKERLLGISKRGDAYMRRQFINGARALVRISSGRTGSFWDWINALLARRAFNVVAVAVANKLARVAWALQARGTRWKTA
jgi:transposase